MLARRRMNLDTHIARWTASAILLTGLAAPLPVASAQDAPGKFDAMASNIERGVTKPKEEPKLAFVAPGVVMVMNVKEGDQVKKGDVLAVQDDRAEVGNVEVAKGEVESAKMQIEAARADLELKTVNLKRLEELYVELIKRGGTNKEIDQARVEVKIADISIKFRETEWNKAKLQQQLQEIQLEQKKLISPIDGYVSKIDVRKGEGTDLSRPAMQVVKVDELHVEVDIQSSKCKNLKVGDTLQVRYTDDEKWLPAKISFMTMYANASSGTRKIRLELKNEANREAGLPVYVKLPDNLAAATK